MQIIDGKIVSAKVLDGLREKVSLLKSKHGITPGLAVIIVGDDPGSQVYVRNKVRAAMETGMYSVKYEFPANAPQDDVIARIALLNADTSIHGLLVQSPPPPHIDERVIIEAIDPAKDIDCFHPYNVGRLHIGDTDGFAPCTPAGIMELLKHYNIATAGKHAVVIGRSNIVGKPMAALLSRKGPCGDCTVTLCHSRTRDLASITSQADILIAAIGRPGFVTAAMVKEGAVVIDVGMNRIPDAAKKSGYRLTGDVDFGAVAPKTSFITPVPGGVGLMTIAMLLANAYNACCTRSGISY